MRILAPKSNDTISPNFVENLETENANFPYDFLELHSSLTAAVGKNSTKGKKQKNYSSTCVKLPTTENIKINNLKWQK